MKVLLVALALLALVASAASTTSGGCGCQTPPFHLPPPFYLPPPVYEPPPQQPQPWQYPTQPPQLSPCQQLGSCGVGSVVSPFLGQCVEFLRHQCSPAATPYGSPQCQALQQQCCHQIRRGPAVLPAAAAAGRARGADGGPGSAAADGDVRSAAAAAARSLPLQRSCRRCLLLRKLWVL
uniref:Mucronate mutant 16 kDa gamma zein n=2 Tax=Zea mays TaxID=4577 RepID=Q00LN5_MAIZE|nr:mucronate mutant 16 kDa gamma zein [Zea mays]ABD63259.1 mucronate mutant 16 kDa gamma zein [Zea mays]